ncbi:MAG: DUF418 domain-containing protein [Bacteroidota bacterium]
MLKEQDRIESLDVIRGFALLGILIMNIQSFSMPGATYLNPAAYGDLNGVNKWVWIISHVFGDSKFMSLFSMLFGASILLITEGAERKTGSSLAIHYKRNFWLLLIGLFHSYIMWHGDILTPYAVIAFMVCPARKMKVRSLLILGTLLFSVSSVLYLMTAMSIPYMSEADLAGLMSSWQPTSDQIQQEIAAFTGSFSEQLNERVKATIGMHTTVFLILFLWRISGLMLIGMALYKSGFFQGDFSKAFYTRTVFIAGGIGLVLVTIGVIQNFEHNWSIAYSFFAGSQWNYWGSLGIAIAYVAIMNIIIKSEMFVSLRLRLAAVGRMALTNYLSQTLIGTFIFYGFGLGLIGQVERWGQLLIVFGIWAVQLIISPIWLKHYQYGPVEWLWRSLTQMKAQKMRKIENG